MEKNYDYLSLIVEISPQTCTSPDDENDYNEVYDRVGNAEYDRALEYMEQWDYGEDTADRVNEIDKCERILIETDEYIITVCDSEHFGHQGDAYFLYRKDVAK